MLISETVPHWGQGQSCVPAHAGMNEIKPLELIERWGMQVSTAGEVHINVRQMCITGSYGYYSYSPNTRSQKLWESQRWQSGTGLHNPVSTIPCTNKQGITNGHRDWVMIWETRKKCEAFWESRTCVGRTVYMQVLYCTHCWIWIHFRVLSLTQTDWRSRGIIVNMKL